MRTRFGRVVRLGVIAAALAGSIPPARAQEPRVVEVEAKRFAFTPGELRLKKDEPVTLRIHSADVTHGLYQKALGIDAEIQPGKTVEVKVTPRAAGRFTAICDHFCGAGHGNMRMEIVVE